MSEDRLRTAGHHAGPRETRAASNPASATSSMITAVVSELTLGSVGYAMRHQSTTLGGQSGICVAYMSSTQITWSTIPSAVGLEITAPWGAAHPEHLAPVSA
jgi:hypothetical protein